jgi:hypothetical protein
MSSYQPDHPARPELTPEEEDVVAEEQGDGDDDNTDEPEDE